MHSCIAALSQGVPCVGVAYSMKFAGVFESVGMGDWVVDGRSVGNAAAVERILELYRGREAVRESLKAAGDRARDELREVFRGIRTLPGNVVA
jgi:polysaccharide pyruvyl transferase WcaK-like protein